MTTHHIVHHTEIDNGGAEPDKGFPRITLSGNADEGWIGEVHDGLHAISTSPQGENFREALDNLLKHYEEEKEKLYGWLAGERTKVMAALEAGYSAMVARWHDADEEAKKVAAEAEAAASTKEPEPQPPVARGQPIEGSPKDEAQANNGAGNPAA